MSGGYANEKPPSSTGSTDGDLTADPASSGFFNTDFKRYFLSYASYGLFSPVQDLVIFCFRCAGPFVVIVLLLVFNSKRGRYQNTKPVNDIIQRKMEYKKGNQQ